MTHNKPDRQYGQFFCKLHDKLTKKCFMVWACQHRFSDKNWSGVWGIRPISKEIYHKSNKKNVANVADVAQSQIALLIRAPISNSATNATNATFATKYSNLVFQNGVVPQEILSEAISDIMNGLHWDYNHAEDVFIEYCMLRGWTV